MGKKHTINVKEHNREKINEKNIVLNSLDEAFDYVRHMGDNIDYIIFDEYDRIIASKINEQRQHYELIEHQERYKYTDDDSYA